MRVQKKHSRHTHSAVKHKKILQKKRNKRICQLCIKCALCTSVFTLTLLTTSEWDIAHPQPDLQNYFAAKITALISANTSKPLLSTGTDRQPQAANPDLPAPSNANSSNTNDKTSTNSTDTNNCTNANHTDTYENTNSADFDNNADTNGANTDNQHTDNQNPASDTLDQTAQAQDSGADVPSSADCDTDKLTQAIETDEQTLYSINPDTDSQLYYSYAGSPIQSVPERLPEEQLIDTTADDTETTHFTQDSSDWNLILVNPWNKLPDDFDISLTRLPNGHSIDSRCYPALTEMMNACRDAGFQPLICSSYRSWDKQKSLFQERIDELLAQGYSKKAAKAKAATSVARPGTSEHQAGLAVDLVDSSYQMLDAAQEYTAVQQWLMENSWKYGFILRYPKDKSRLTGIIYEPWHYRYVGLEAAQEIYERGICLEEYLEERLGEN